MTKRTAELLCRAIGIPCKWDAEWEEFNVNRDSYFTDCPFDAVLTAVEMAHEARMRKASISGKLDRLKSGPTFV